MSNVIYYFVLIIGVIFSVFLYLFIFFIVSVFGYEVII